MKTLISTALFASILFGQTKDASPRSMANSGTLPATCTVGQTYFRTGVTAGENVYGCTSTNTWTLQSGGGSAPTAGTGISILGSTVSIDDTVTATRAQVQSGADTTCVDSGGDDTYACTLTPPLGSYTTGMRLSLKVSTTNTGAATVDAGPGAKTIKTASGATLADGDIVAGAAISIMYDGTDFRLGGGGGAVDPFSTTSMTLIEEFTPNFALGALTWSVSGGLTAEYIPNETNHPGILRLTNSSGTTSFLDLNRGDDVVTMSLATQTNWEARWIIRTNEATTSAQAVGFYDSTGIANYIWAISYAVDSANWQFCRRAASDTANCVSSGVAIAASSWFTIRLRSTTAGTILASIAAGTGSFSTEKTICASGCDLNGTMPTTQMTPFAYVYAPAIQTMDFDRFAYTITGLSR